MVDVDEFWTQVERVGVFISMSHEKVIDKG